jgi:hypothetical protein
MLVGCAGGGILFVVLDQLAIAQGGFLRKYTTTVEYLTKRRKERNAVVIGARSKVQLPTPVPADAIRRLVDLVFPVSFEDGETPLT